MVRRLSGLYKRPAILQNALCCIVQLVRLLIIPLIECDRRFSKFVGFSGVEWGEGLEGWDCVVLLSPYFWVPLSFRIIILLFWVWSPTGISNQQITSGHNLLYKDKSHGSFACWPWGFFKVGMKGMYQYSWGLRGQTKKYHSMIATAQLIFYFYQVK